MPRGGKKARSHLINYSVIPVISPFLYPKCIFFQMALPRPVKGASEGLSSHRHDGNCENSSWGGNLLIEEVSPITLSTTFPTLCVFILFDFYRVAHLLGNLGWVDSYLGSSRAGGLLLEIPIAQAGRWNIPDLNQNGSSLQGDAPPCRHLTQRGIISPTYFGGSLIFQCHAHSL